MFTRVPFFLKKKMFTWVSQTLFLVGPYPNQLGWLFFIVNGLPNYTFLFTPLNPEFGLELITTRTVIPTSTFAIFTRYFIENGQECTRSISLHLTEILFLFLLLKYTKMQFCSMFIRCNKITFWLHIKTRIFNRIVILSCI